MFKRFIICVSLIAFIFTQVSFFCISVSAAELPSYNMPDLDNYPDGIDGAIEFVGDCYQQVASGFVSGFCDSFCYPLDIETAYEDKFGFNPFLTPGEQIVSLYDLYRDWYLGHGSHTGGGGYRDGSVIDTDGSYSWNIPVTGDDRTVYLDDGCGGFFTIIDNSHVVLPSTQVVDFMVYHRGSLVIQYKQSVSSQVTIKPQIAYNVYTVPDSSNAIFWVAFCWGHESFVTLPYTDSNISSSYVMQNSFGSVYNRAAFTYKYVIKDYSNPAVQSNSTTLYSYNPLTNSIENYYYYGADLYGQPCLYDSNNTLYNFNDDGTLGDSHLYLIPDFSTLNDNDKIELTNLVTNYYMSVYFNLLRINNSDNSDILPFLTSILNQLMGINANTSDAQTWLKSINSNVVRLDNDLNTWLRAINDTILSLDTGSGDNSDLIILLTELKKGLLGDSEPYKPDQIIDLLEQIAKNTSPDPENLDEQPIDFQFDYYVQTVPDMLRERLDVSSYFKQLKNIFSMFFTDDFLSDIDFDEYFNTENYMISDESTDSSEASAAAVSYSTADYPEVFGEELAEEDVDISSSVYLTASVYSSGATIEGSTIPAPYLEVHIMGHTYNLFEYLTPEVYDKIKPLKNLISLVLYAFYFLWVVRSVIPSLFTGSNLNFYNSTSEDL